MISAFSLRRCFPVGGMSVAFAAIALLLFACDSQPAVQEPRADQLAKALCACSTPLLLLNQKHQTKSDSLAFREIFLEYEKARACVAALGIKPDDRPALDASMAVHCPGLVAQPELFRELLGD